MSVSIVFTTIFCIVYYSVSVPAQLQGTDVTCSVEGESIKVPNISDMLGYECICKNHSVMCTCPKIESCYVYENPLKNKSCPKCRGCTKNGVFYESFTEWTDPREPCTLFMCVSGVITESTIRCYTPCRYPEPPAPGQCCPTCSECLGVNDRRKISLISTKDPCISCNCTLKALSCTKKICPALNCPKSEIFYHNNSCCPQCQGIGTRENISNGTCSFNNTSYESGKQFILDKCTKCICENSTLHCKRKSCPDLKCKIEQRETLPAKCCSQCIQNSKKNEDRFGTGNKIDNSDWNKEKYQDENDDESLTEDKHGNNDLTFDEVENNNVLEDEYERLDSYKGKYNSDNGDKRENKFEEFDDKNGLEYHAKGGKEKEKTCQVANTLHKNGEIWKTKKCENCTCYSGKINCAKIMCPAISCPSNSVLKVPEGECCPMCSESNGICTVFKGSHFRTFDKKTYAFTGSCNYYLIHECDSETFSIELENDVRGGHTAMKRISIKSEKLVIDMKQNKITKVNDRVIDYPYTIKKLRINEEDGKIIVNLAKLGVKVLWDHVGFLEVTVAKNYHKKLCGLCGNFNLLESDDFITQEGIAVKDPAIFAQSWTVGNEDCFETRNYGIRGCNPRRDRRLCSYMKGSVFERCLRKINVTSYYETCLKDMCQCSPDDVQCHCESFATYVYDCQRLGILIPARWRDSVGC